MKIALVKRQHGYRSLTAMLATIVILSGCGSDDEAIPTESTIDIQPASKPWTIPMRASPCPYDPNLWVDERVLVTVKNKDAVPLGDIQVAISADLTAAYTSGVQESLQLYVDGNGNRIVDVPPDVLVSGNGSPAYVTHTDEYTGAVAVLLRVNLSCPFRGNVIVTAGPLYGSASFEVVEATAPAP